MAGHDHGTTGGRPIHPECAKLDNYNDACTCDEHWGGWQGDLEGLDRAISVQLRLDSRRVDPSKPGHVADADEVDDAQHATATNVPAHGHFFKRSEDLKCRRGDRLRCDERGLPLNYGNGYNWLRAQQADSDPALFRHPENTDD